MSRFLLSLLLVAGCSTDIKLTAQASCDGVLQPEEDGAVDSPFDVDGDGFFDAANPGCAGTYAPEYLDCNDGDPDVSPGAAEVTCDGIDNDCDDMTPDTLDQDGDGYGDCDDCDDSNDLVSPGLAEVACDGIDNDCDDMTPDAVDDDGDGYDACEDCDDGDIYQSPGLAEIDCNGIDDDCDDMTPDAVDDDGDGASVCDDDCDDTDPERSPDLDEVCEDGIDNNCDGDVDEQCSYTGVWTLDRAISYQCAYFYVFYLVDFSFSGLYIDDLGSTLTAAPTSSGAQPGTTYGSFSSDTAFSTVNTIPGSGPSGCTETYTFSGTFLDSNTLSGTFEADYAGGGCLDCSHQSIIFTATR